MTNKFDYIYKEEQIDKKLEEGWDYEHANLPHGLFSLESFIGTLKVYQSQNVNKGPLKIHIYDSKCDPIEKYSFYHEKPLSDNDRTLLERRRLEIKLRNDFTDTEIIKRYQNLVERRGQRWIDQHSTEQENTDAAVRG